MFADFLQKLMIFQTDFFQFEIAAVQKYANLVELEKCCQTHIFLQNFVLIQPRTTPPKICNFFKTIAKFAILLNRRHLPLEDVVPGPAQRRVVVGLGPRDAEAGPRRAHPAVGPEGEADGEEPDLGSK